MSYALDANVLLYASDQTSPKSKAAQRVIDEAAAGPELVYLAWPTVMAYLRIATHSGIFDTPLTSAEALGNVSALLELPHVRAVAESDGFLDAYRRLTNQVVVRGNLVPDAHVATILLQHGVTTIYTNDRDFLKFPRLTVRDPFEAP